MDASTIVTVLSVAVVVGTLVAEPPMTVAYTIEELDDRRTIPVERSSESPTKQEREIAADQSVGELTREPRARPAIEVADRPLDELAFDDIELREYESAPGLDFAVAE